MSTAVDHEAALRIGVDLGGTGSRIVAIDTDGQVVNERVVDTRSFRTSDALATAELLIAHIAGVADEMPIRGVGVGASGPLDAKGIIRNPDTLPEFLDVDVASLLSEKLGVLCKIESDADVFTLGEFHLGAGRGARSLVGVTLGTGVGVGVVADGAILRGGDGLHAEGGHIPTPGPPAPCYCGLSECWEQRASRTALDQLASTRLGYDDLAAAATAARAGDEAALAVFDDYGRAVGIGVATLATLFRPEMIVLGGGAAPHLDLALDGLHAAVTRRGGYALTAQITASALGVQAGAVGAATLV